MNKYYYIVPPYSFPLGVIGRYLMEEIKPYNFNEKLSGKLAFDERCPLLYIKFEGSSKFYTAIIDTGSYVSGIKESIINELGISKSNEFHKIIHPTYGVMDMQKFNLDFELKRCTGNFNENFILIYGNYPFPVILGTLFLSKCKEFHYYPDKNRFDLFL